MAEPQKKHSPKIPASAAIMTYNSAGSVRKALESVKEFAEIIICDGGSKDETLAIAKEYGAKVISDDPKFKEPGLGLIDYAGVRNQQLEAAQYKWFYFIDSDEYLEEGTADEIRSIVESDHPEAYAWWQPRKYVVDGVVIDQATTYPNKQMRFFHKDYVTKFIKPAHERIELKPGTQVSTLKHFEYVPLPSPQELKKRWDKARELEARMQARHSTKKYIKSLMRHIALAGLYILRHIKIICFGKGTRLAFSYELLRHRYNLLPIVDDLRGLFKIS
jgi:glycosyltransferase involved in cell wall biosynthesis